MRINPRSISFRVAALAALSALIIALAAGLTVWTFRLADSRIEAALQSQQRLDLWSNATAAITRYTLTAIDTANGPRGSTSLLDETRRSVHTSFDAIDLAIRDGMTAAPSETTRTAIANRGRLLTHLMAGFDVLDRQVTNGFNTPAGPSADDIRGALNGFAATFAPTLSGAMDDERRTASRIRDEMQDLGARLTAAGFAVALIGISLSYLLFAGLARPLVDRIGQMGAMAAAIGRGDLGRRLTTSGHDELGLAAAIFNRTAARLQGREARVAADRDHLESLIAERTADLTAANARLAEIDVARQRFFTDVSHELRTPLTVILGECDLTLRRPAAGAEPEREALTTIAHRARRLHRRVEDLLRIARSGSGEIDLTPVPSDALGIVTEAIADTASLARRAGITLDARCEPEGLTARVDPDWLRQVIEGLIANAIRHSPRGSRIAIAARAEADQTLIEVRDHGSGIAASDLPHVFKRFYRGGSGTGSGFGIGLSLAKWVIERSGGRIEIESRTAAEALDGQAAGTIIRLTLPGATSNAHS